MTLRRLALSTLTTVFLLTSLLSQAQQPEIRTGIFRGQKVTYTWVPSKESAGMGLNIYQGDIILDHVQQLPGSSVQINSLGAAYSQYLWKPVGSVYEIPYIIDPASGNVSNINAAITQFNNTFSGVLQFVAYTNQPDYVDFNLNPNDNSGVCESSEGRVGGEQFALGAGGTQNPCTVATILHEMGHIVGVWHEQSRPDRDTYVNVNYGAVIKASRSNFDKLLDNDQALTLYDYASIMEYPAFSFSRNGQPCIETIPAGIPLSNSTGYTASDVDGIERLYGAIPTSVTVTSNPPGLKVVVDGNAVSTPQVFNWSLNSSHTLGVASTPQTINGINYIYGRWNDATAASHSVTVTPGNNMVTQPATSPAVTVYTANFIQLVPYANTVSPAGTGTVATAPNPLSYSGLSGLYYTARQLVTLTATPSGGQNFYNYINSPYWLPGGNGANPKTFYVPDNGTGINLTTYFTSSPVYTVSSNPVEEDFYLFVDSSGTYWNGPVNFALPYDSSWTPSSTHSIGTYSPQNPFSFDTQFVFSDWSDGGALTHNITLPSSGGATYTANITPEYTVTSYALESCAGSVAVTPGPNGQGYYSAGSLVSVAETSNTGWIFTGWEYDLSGTGSPQNLTVNDEELVAADFSTTSTRLQLNSISPPSIAAGSAGFTLTINGQGFTSSTAAYIGGFYRQATFVSSTQVTVPILSSDIATPGAFQVAVGNFPGGATCAAYVPTTFYVLLATGATASVTPSNLNFANVATGTTSASQPITLTNNGTGALSIGSIVASGDFAETNNCSSSLAAQSSCTVNVTFSPRVAGNVAGAVTFNDGAGSSPQLVALAGAGVAPLSFKPTSLKFSSTAVGRTAAKSVTVTNNESTTISLNPSLSANYSITGGSCGASLGAGSNCTMTVTFAPTSNGSIDGSLAIPTSGPLSPEIVALAGTGTGGPTAPLTFSPTTLSFAKTGIDIASAPKTITVTNSSASSVTINSMTGSATFLAVGSGVTPCGGPLAASAKCTMSVTFTPSETGSTKGSVAIATSGAGSPQVIDVTGTGAIPVTLSPVSLSFGTQAVGTTSAPQTVTLTNSSGGTLTISSIATSGDFTATPSGSKACGATLAAKGKCTFSVTFTPNLAGAITGAVTVTHNAPLGPAVVKLTGTGQ